MVMLLLGIDMCIQYINTHMQMYRYNISTTGAPDFFSASTTTTTISDLMRPRHKSFIGQLRGFGFAKLSTQSSTPRVL